MSHNFSWPHVFEGVVCEIVNLELSIMFFARVRPERKDDAVAVSVTREKFAHSPAYPLFVPFLLTKLWQRRCRIVLNALGNGHVFILRIGLGVRTIGIGLHCTPKRTLNRPLTQMLPCVKHFEHMRDDFCGCPPC